MSGRGARGPGGAHEPFRMVSPQRIACLRVDVAAGIIPDGGERAAHPPKKARSPPAAPDVKFSLGAGIRLWKDAVESELIEWAESPLEPAADKVADRMPESGRPHVFRGQGDAAPDLLQSAYLHDPDPLHIRK